MVSHDTLTSIFLLLVMIGAASSILYVARKFYIEPGSTSRGQIIWDYFTLAAVVLTTWLYDLGTGLVLGMILAGLEIAYWIYWRYKY